MGGGGGGGKPRPYVHDEDHIAPAVSQPTDSAANNAEQVVAQVRASVLFKEVQISLQTNVSRPQKKQKKKNKTPMHADLEGVFPFRGRTFPLTKGSHRNTTRDFLSSLLQCEV